MGNTVAKHCVGLHCGFSQHFVVERLASQIKKKVDSNFSFNFSARLIIFLQIVIEYIPVFHSITHFVVVLIEAIIDISEICEPVFLDIDTW